MSKDNASRRTMLKRLGTGMAGSSLLLSGVAPVSAANPKKHKGANSQSMVLTKDNALSKSEREQGISDVKKKHGEQAAKAIRGEALTSAETTVRAQGELLENVVRQDDWKMTYDVHDSFGQLIADTHHWLVLYKAKNRDQNGDVVHFYRMLSLSEAPDPWHYQARTTEMFNYVNLRRSYNDLTQVAPTTVITKESGTVTVSVGVSAGPVSASVGQQVAASGGRISPVGEYLHYGEAGGYAVQFKGDNPHSTSLPGVMDYRGSGYNHKWRTRVEGKTL